MRGAVQTIEKRRNNAENIKKRNKEHIFQINMCVLSAKKAVDKLCYNIPIQWSMYDHLHVLERLAKGGASV